MGQTSASSSSSALFEGELLTGLDFRSSIPIFLADARQKPDWPFKLESLRSTNGDPLKLLSVPGSPTESGPIGCGGHPKTASNGIGLGGGRYVSGVDISRLKSTRNPLVSAVAAPSLDVRDSCSSGKDGHYRKDSITSRM